ncbi:MAG: type II secretion system protein [Candidatus Krumholzibacteriota bacterium]|nr:type II secretion system protein [Candidatus Krumholzibacteriota bacterium]
MLVRNDSKGFTLIELMFVVVIIGIIAAIAIPNYMKFTKKAKNAVVQENMHTIRLAMETFSVDQLGNYPQAADEAAFLILLPGGQYPDNPFTNQPTQVLWNADPADPGDISIYNLPGGGYMLRGRGDHMLLDDIVSGE